MGSISTVIGLDRVSAVVGWGVEATLEGVGLGFLPQHIGILASAEEAFESSSPSLLDFTTAKEVGAAFGYGSMAYQIARIMRPLAGGNLGGIPTKILKVAKPAGGVAKVINFTVTGTATGSATHFLKVNGRTSIDGTSFSFVVNKDDTNTEIAQSMADALNRVLGATMTGTKDVSDNFVATAKSAGAFTEEYNIEVITNDNSVGITYAEIAGTAGAGSPSVATAIGQLGDIWIDHIVNGYGSDSDTLAYLELFNGNANTKSGRYAASTFKPFIAYMGDNTITTLAEAIALTDTPVGRKLEMTNVFCPAPNSKGTAAEAAANMCVLYAPIAQSTPHLDPIGLVYPDMPIEIDANFGDFGDVDKRDQIVKAGCSTVLLNGGYEVVDFATTYHPDDEPPTAVSFRWASSIVGGDFNFRYAYKILEQIYVVGKTILDDADISSVDGTIKPSRWKAILITDYATSMIDNALMTDIAYFTAGLEVQKGESNASRFETKMTAKKTSIARVLSTTIKTTFSYS